MRHESTLLRDVPGLYRAAASALGRLQAAMLRYHGAARCSAPGEANREPLEEYVACGQLYRTTLEMLFAALTDSESGSARKEAARVEGLLWRHDALMRNLYEQTRARQTADNYRPRG